MKCFDRAKLDVYQAAIEFELRFPFAKRSATECAAIIDVCVHLNILGKWPFHFSKINTTG
ncbi:hypothetical protein K8T06_07075 [bacterium]|nr:hypothetical protein [bacterium]